MRPLQWLRSFHLSSDSEDSVSHGAAATSSARAQLSYMLRRSCSYYFRHLRCSVSQSGSGTCGISSATMGRMQSGLSSVWSFDEFAANQSQTGSGFQFDGTHDKSPCTDALLISYLVTHWAQFSSTERRLYFWGAKVNSSIRGGQIWRLLTSAFLHNNVLHLMVNYYSMNNVGPAVEDFYGTQQLGYILLQLYQIGASWVYIWRHKDAFDQAEKHLNSLSLCIAFNIAVGLILRRFIDNWCHVGGLLGGASFSWHCLADTTNTN